MQNTAIEKKNNGIDFGNYVFNPLIYKVKLANKSVELQ